MDLICFCHLRWDFVYQRPQHLMSRFAKINRVFLIEEPLFDATHTNYMVISSKENLTVAIPHFKKDLPEKEIIAQQITWLKDILEEESVTDYFIWYYSPMALPLGSAFNPQFIVYDCMDELSLFKDAPALLRVREKEMFKKADLVFTGGHNLYNAKKDAHHNIYPFPSSIDKEHFAQARHLTEDPLDQAEIPHPRLGFFGVIDERFDVDLISQVAKRMPDWHFVMIGPIIKIDPKHLPKLENIHYLGGKHYDELPKYLAGWEIALIPFARNNATKYISPTKTPEYLAAGKPVISTSIVDVVNPYGKDNLVQIADTPDDFITAAQFELTRTDREDWLAQVDEFLLNNSWDNTWSQMNQLITLTETLKNANLNKEIYV